MMRLIDADKINFLWTPIAPFYISNDVHYEPVAFKWEIDAQPVIDAVPVKHGVWFGTVCSCCGESTSDSYDCEYCPHCGARMDAERKEK